MHTYINVEQIEAKLPPPNTKQNKTVKAVNLYSG